MTRTTTLALTTIAGLTLAGLTHTAPVQAQDGPKAEKAPEAKKDLPKKDLPKKDLPKKTETTSQRIERLVGELGHAKYDVREKAFDQLLSIGRAALPALRRAAQSDDPEVASAAAEAVELIRKGKKAAGPVTPDKAAPNPQRGRNGQRLPTPSREELMKELQKALPKDVGKAFKRFFKDANPNEDQERSGRFQSRVRVWTFTNTPRRPQLDGVAGRLGLKVGPTSGVLRAQLSIRKGEGLVVNHLVKDGFVAGHGVELYDVLLTRDGRPIRTRADLLTLADKGGLVEVFRKAKLIKIKLPTAPAPKVTTSKSKPASSPKPTTKSEERDF